MDTRDLEEAALIVYAMCKQHPEICPHRWHFSNGHCLQKDSKSLERTYKCEICGSSKTINEPLTESEINEQKHKIKLTEEAKKKYTIGKKYRFKRYLTEGKGVLIDIDFFAFEPYRFDCGITTEYDREVKDIRWANEIIKEVKE